MRIRSLSVLALLVALYATAGCALDRPGHSYATNATFAQRDTYTAQRLNDEGLTQINGGKYPNAEESFRKALEADVFFAPAHNNLGLVLMQQGKAYEAAWEFQFAAKLLPNAVEPRNNLGLVMERVTHIDEAIGHYEEALKIDPNNIEVMGHLARARIKPGEEPENLHNLLKRLTFQNPGGTWDQWARQQLLAIGRDE